MAISEFVPCNGLFSTALTLAQPLSIAKLIIPSPLNNSQSAKFLTSYVNELCHLATSVVAPKNKLSGGTVGSRLFGNEPSRFIS
jgi:hypothetical protein